MPFSWNVWRCLVREIEKEHDPRRAPMFICLPRQIPPTPAHRPAASGTPSRGVWAAPKPSAQGEFISPEQVPSSGQREKARRGSCLFPLVSECNYRTWKGPGISMVCRPSTRGFIHVFYKLSAKSFSCFKRSIVSLMSFPCADGSKNDFINCAVIWFAISS